MTARNDAHQKGLFDSEQDSSKHTIGHNPSVTQQLVNSSNFGAQQSLALDGDVAPKPLGKTPEQLASFEMVLQRVRSETAQILAAAIEIGKTPYECLTDLPIELLRQARVKALGEGDFLHPSPDDSHRPAAPTAISKAKNTRSAYRPWTEERKLSNRGRKLNERINKKFSIPELLHPELQAAVLENPEYYGVCPLPSETSCVVKPNQRLGWIRSEEAKALEATLREQERT